MKFIWKTSSINHILDILEKQYSRQTTWFLSGFLEAYRGCMKNEPQWTFMSRKAAQNAIFLCLFETGNITGLCEPLKLAVWDVSEEIPSEKGIHQTLLIDIRFLQWLLRQFLKQSFMQFIKYLPVSETEWRNQDLHFKVKSSHLFHALKYQWN